MQTSFVAPITMLAAASVILASSPALAASISIGETTYSLEFVSGSYDYLFEPLSPQEKLAQLPWFGDPSLASIFASELGDSEGFPNGFSGPLFAHGKSSQGALFSAEFIPGVFIPVVFPDRDFTYARVTSQSEQVSIPTPALIPGLIGFGLSVVHKKRKLSS